MSYSRVLAVIVAFLFLCPVMVLAGANTTITVWYPAGDITVSARLFADRSVFAEFEAKHNVEVDTLALDCESPLSTTGDVDQT